MSTPRPNVPDAVRDAQTKASNPEASAFVAANAGSGKTHVLVNRVIRLLLAGVPPEKILCITFTKAAAANMAGRIFTTLGHWVTLNDEELNDAIRAAGAARPDAKLRSRARELFACALETPGGLKVQTIHALCTRLLQQFPFEANVPAHFAVMDDRDRNEMMERASLVMLLQAAAQPDSAAGRALATAMTSVADVTFRDVVREASLSRDKFLGWITRAGSTEAAVTQLSASLGVKESDHVEDVERDIVDGPHLPRPQWEALAAILDTGNKTDQGQAARLREASALTGSEQADKYLGVFLTDKMEPRKSPVTRAIGTARPDVAQMLTRESERVVVLLEKRRAVAMRDRTQALLIIANGVAANYGREKQERGLLDYDDLIDKTLAMLEGGASGWVHFKLDRGVDHVLIDEAQDTSPRQWDIVFHLISEFTAGEGARDGIKRTIFAVGDEKQSIFSFQGAAPREFDTRRRALEKQFRDAGLAFDPVSFTYSFRSGIAILRSVDQVFHEEAIYRSIHAVENNAPIHHSLADAAPSLIDLWPLQEPDPKQDIEGWRAPFDAVSETGPEVKLARRVQAEIASLISAGTMTGTAGKRRALRFGDILVLVRRRSKAFDAIIQTLKHKGIPVAGADRLKLTEHIAIIDLMNLADALLLPLDDLALATALKSPLFGLDDDDLFKLAWPRKGSLRAEFREQADTNDKFHAAHRYLSACENRFASETPFSFYAWLLGGQGPEQGGRTRILKRLGHEANDALDEFLELALNYEQKAPASLQGFMAWLRAADTDVKRDMEISRDEVRVMTVHGAKGLEAPVVFLVDTTSSPSDTQRLNLIHLPQSSTTPHAPGITVWAGRKADDPPAIAAARAAMTAETEDEYRRLLYVAMTRAADRLIVGGVLPGNRKAVRELSWYDLIVKGLDNSGLRLHEFETAHGAVKRYSRTEDIDSPAGAAMPQAPAPAAQLPAWLRVAVPRETPAESLLRPSDPGDNEGHHVLAAELRAARAKALQRGTLVHRLLQSLPDIASDRRGDAAAKYLARNAGGWSEGERDALAAQVLALVGDPRFAPVFAEGSRAEVAIAGRLTTRRGQPVMVSGQIDRLVVTSEDVLIVDFKTNHAPPQTAAAAPAAYVRQLALYRAVLARLYPALPVKAALLWTETPEMMEISASALDAELATIISV